MTDDDGGHDRVIDRIVETDDDRYLDETPDDGERYADQTAERSTYAFEMATGDGTATVEVSSPEAAPRVEAFGLVARELVQRADGGEPGRRPLAVEIPEEEADREILGSTRSHRTASVANVDALDPGPFKTLHATTADGADGEAEEPVAAVAEAAETLPSDPPHEVATDGVSRTDDGWLVELKARALTAAYEGGGVVDRSAVETDWTALRDGGIAAAAGDVERTATVVGDVAADRLARAEVTVADPERDEGRDGVSV